MIDYKSTAIIIFAYNRPSHFKRVLVALEDYGIKKFYVNLDGPKNIKDKIIQSDILFAIHNIKFAKLVKIEIYFELLSFSVLKIKIKKAPNKGKKITDDKIGKSIILKLNKLLKQTVLLT